MYKTELLKYIKHMKENIEKKILAVELNSKLPLTFKKYYFSLLVIIRIEKEIANCENEEIKATIEMMYSYYNMNFAIKKITHTQYCLVKIILDSIQGYYATMLFNNFIS